MRTVVGGLVLVGMLALSGCVESTPLPTLPPTSTTAPIFASEEEALAAAEAAYAAYSEVADLIASEGGANPERIAPYVTEKQLQSELESAEFYRDHGIRAVGRASTTEVVLQQVSENNGVATVVVYVCIDVNEIRILDATDSDVTPSDRPPVAALEVSLEGDAPDSLRVADSDLWPDSSFCSA